MEPIRREVVNVELAYEEGEENPLEAPAITEWYHGVLSRSQANQLLLKVGRPGAYLIRERVLPQDPAGAGGEQEDGGSDCGRYALSLLSHEYKPYHFKIRSYYGTYLIGGTSFESLQSLVGYYTNKGFILSGRHLAHPVPPAGEPVEVKERLVAVLPYHKNPDSDELSFAKGDVFLKEEELSGGWLWVTALHSRASGLVHSKLVRPMSNDLDVKPEALDYYYGPEVSQEDVKAALTGQPIGSYLLRHSERFPGNYTLYVVCPYNSNSPNPNHIKRFPITAEGNKLYMGKPDFKIDFNTIEEIVDRYRSREIAEGCCLTMPILKRRTPGAHGQFGAASGPDEEDIYDSVRRAQRPLLNALSPGSDNVLEGYLFKFNKKWKRMYFTLKRSGDLLYFEGSKSGQQPPQKIKPKGFIDLKKTDLYPAHHSLHGKENCFQLVVANPHQSSQVHVLHCESEAEAENWRKTFKYYCANTHEASDLEQKRQNPRCVRDLVVTVYDAHNMSTNKPYVCVLALNGVQVARTSAQDGKDPSWDEEFQLLDLPGNMSTLTISVYLKGRRREGECEVQHERQLADLEGEMQDTESQDGKKLRVATRFSQLMILPRDRLAPIEYALLKDPQVFGPLAKFAEEKLDENQRKTLAQSLLNIFLMNDRQAELILGIGKAVVDAGNKDALTFRQNTLLSALLLCYMRLTALSWMHDCLDRVTQEILKLGKMELDTDPSHCPMCSAIQQKPVPLHHSGPGTSSGSSSIHGNLSFSATGAASSSMSGCMCDKNSAKLNELLTIAVTDICEKRPFFPPILRHVLSQLHKRVVTQWFQENNDTSDPPSRDVTFACQQQQQAKVHVVAASFIFLRFLCKALYQPGSMSLTREQPGQAALSTMKSLAGLIQNLGNGSQPKNKKFEVMQPYLEELQPRITDFIVELMTCQDMRAPEPSDVELDYKKNISLSRDCSQVLSLLRKHLDAIREFPDLEKLVSAVEAVEATGCTSSSSSNTPRR